MYVRATDETGDHWYDPALVAIGPGSAGAGCCLAIVGGRPAISCLDAGAGTVLYVRSLNSDGTGWPAGAVTVGTTPASLPHTSLAVVSGRPAIVWCDQTADWELIYSRGDDADGTAFSSPVTVDDSWQMTGFQPELAVVNGRPAIAYCARDLFIDYTQADIRYIRALDADGASWDTPVAVNVPGTLCSSPSLAVIAGRPSISYYSGEGNDLWYVRALDADGSSWGAPELVDATGSTGTDSSLVDNNGRPAVAYHNLTEWSVWFATPRQP
jgi:hypothetical protein